MKCSPHQARLIAEARLEAKARGLDLTPKMLRIAPETPFRQWCQALAEQGLKVDGHPFTLENRKALWAIYDLIPTHIEDAYDKIVVLQKGAQMGLTVMEVLADLYMAIKWEPVTLGMYVPDSKLAPYKSRHRFLRIIRSVPGIYERMTKALSAEGAFKSVGEGNVLTRTLGESIFLFLWTSGAITTESFPMDVVSFDEVQGMTPEDISRTRERLSASRVRFTLLLSTPVWPDADINYWYLQGTQHEFYTRCDACGAHSALVEHFPGCIRHDPASGDYAYHCPQCARPIADTQAGEWRATYPERAIQSYHLSQLLSPTISARQILDEWRRAATGAQKQNVYNRKLGLPYADPDQIPVTLAVLKQCAEEGRRAGLEWKRSAPGGTYMGIDQMGLFNVVILKERLPDGRQAVIHAEAIYSDDPFARCDALIGQYGVQCCVVESLPNYNDAKRFAGRHLGTVFLAHYSDLKDDMLAWGDASIGPSARRSVEEERDRYTVGIHQYKMMQVALMRFVNRHCLFPDPSGLWQDILENGEWRKAAIVPEMLWLHLTKTALVSEQDPETRKYRPKVMKVGLDPHFAFANMLCDVAWARAHGTSTFYFPEVAPPPGGASLASDKSAVQIPGQLAAMLARRDEDLQRETCAACAEFDAERGFCAARAVSTGANDPVCPLFVPES